MLYQARIFCQFYLHSLKKKHFLNTILKDFIVCGKATLSLGQTLGGFKVNSKNCGSDKTPGLGGINGVKQHMMLWVDDKNELVAFGRNNLILCIIFHNIAEMD